MTGRVLVTGASGFIGRALVADLAAAGHPVRAAMRQPADIFARTVEVVAVSDLTRPVEWRALLKDVETVVHLAGIAHAGPEIAEQAYDRVNRLATAELAETAQRMGVQRLVFASSIRAQCGPVASSVLDETDAPNPTDAYGRSKLAAEQAIRASNVPFTILRPVLIYGPGVKGNLARLARWARSPWPLPFGSFSNRRSILGAPEPDRSHPLFAAHARHRGRDVRGGRSRAVDARADHRGVARRSRPLTGAAADPARSDRRRHSRRSARPRSGIGWPANLSSNPGKLMRAGWQPTVRSAEGLAAMMRGRSQRRAQSG